MRRLKDYLVPLQKGDSRLTPSRPVRTSVLGSVSPPTSFPALDTGRLLATRPCIKSKSKKWSLLGTWLTYRASFAHDGLVRVLSCHFQKSGLTGGGVFSELPKSDERNVEKCLANASTIFRKDFKSPWGCRTPVHESFQETRVLRTTPPPIKTASKDSTTLRL